MQLKGAIAPVGAAGEETAWQQGDGKWYKGFGKGGKGKDKGKGKGWEQQSKGKGKGKNWWSQDYTKQFDLNAAVQAALEKHLATSQAGAVLKPNLLPEGEGEARLCLTCGTAHDNPTKTNCRKRNCNGIVPLLGQSLDTLRTPTLPTKGSKQFQTLVTNKYAAIWAKEQEKEKEAAPEEDSTMAMEEEPPEEEADEQDEMKATIAEIKGRIKHFKLFPKKHPEAKLKAAEEELRALQPQAKQSESQLQKDLWVLKQQQEQEAKAHQDAQEQIDLDVTKLQKQMDELRVKVAAKVAQKAKEEEQFAEEAKRIQCAIQMCTDEINQVAPAPLRPPQASGPRKLTHLPTMEQYQDGIQKAITEHAELPGEVQEAFLEAMATVLQARAELAARQRHVAEEATRTQEAAEKAELAAQATASKEAAKLAKAQEDQQDAAGSAMTDHTKLRPDAPSDPKEEPNSKKGRKDAPEAQTVPSDDGDM